MIDVQETQPSRRCVSIAKHATGDSAMRGMLALCTAILAAAALYLARSIFTPVAFSLFAMAIVWPFQRELQARMPKLVALLFTLLLTLIVLGALALAIAWGSSQVGQWLMSHLDRFQFIYTKTNEWLEGHGIFATAMLADRFDVSWLVRFAQQVAARLNSMTGFALLIFAFTILGLMEVDQVGIRIKKLESQYPHLQLSPAAERIAGQSECHETRQNARKAVWRLFSPRCLPPRNSNPCR
jgi:AI-2 transport protein TqsA